MTQKAKITHKPRPKPYDIHGALCAHVERDAEGNAIKCLKEADRTLQNGWLCPEHDKKVLR